MARVPRLGIRPRPRLHQLRAGCKQRVDQGGSRPVRRQGQEKGEAMTSSQHHTKHHLHCQSQRLCIYVQSW